MKNKYGVDSDVTLTFKKGDVRKVDVETARKLDRAGFVIEPLGGGRLRVVAEPPLNKEGTRRPAW